jgi:hypothetical protein
VTCHSIPILASLLLKNPAVITVVLLEIACHQKMKNIKTHYVTLIKDGIWQYTGPKAQ